MAWTGGEARRVAQVYRLPNPEASYRLGTVSTDFTAAMPQIEILPVKLPDNVPTAGNGLYVARLTGDRFEGIQHEPLVSMQSVSDTSPEKWNWRLILGVKLSDGKNIELEPMPEINIAGEGEIATWFDTFDPRSWASWAPERCFEFKIGADDPIDPADIQPIVESLSRFEEAPGVRVIIDALKKDGLAKGDTISGRLPLGQAAPDFSRLQPDWVEEIGQFDWPENAAGLDGLTHAQYEKYMAVAAQFNDDNRDNVISLLDKLKARWLELRKPGKAGTRARYEPIEKDGPEANPQEGLGPPFAQFAMVRFSRADGQLEDGDRRLLIDAVQNKIECDRFVAGQAVAILDALTLPAKDVAIPLPVCVELLEVDGLNEEKTGQLAVGFHWLPEDAEMDALGGDNPLGPRMYRLRREAVFGSDAMPRLTGFSGPGTAASLHICQRGEPL